MHNSKFDLGLVWSVLVSLHHRRLELDEWFQGKDRAEWMDEQRIGELISCVSVVAFAALFFAASICTLWYFVASFFILRLKCRM
jgi:hypothetical protein